MDYRGVIIEESLEDLGVLANVKVLKRDVETVTADHKTPWLKQWTMDTVEIPEGEAVAVAEKLSHSIDPAHKSSWYADFKNDSTHFVIFRDKWFKIDRAKKEEYAAATAYGISIGIPPHQVDFSPDIKEWERGR